MRVGTFPSDPAVETGYTIDGQLGLGESKDRGNWYASCHRFLIICERPAGLMEL
jgi:hypothetical protein